MILIPPIDGFIVHYLHIRDYMCADLILSYVITADVFSRLNTLKYTACLQHPLLLALQPLSSALEENKGTECLLQLWSSLVHVLFLMDYNFFLSEPR